MSESAVSAPQSKPSFSLWQRVSGWVVNPWGKPRFLVLITWALHAVGDRPGDHRHPVLVQRQPLADGLAGLLDPVVLEQTRTPCGTTRSSATPWCTASRWRPGTCSSPSPIGVTLALGLARWRSRGSGGANFLMLFPLVTPEIVMGVSLLLLFTQLPPFTHIHTGGLAQVLGHVTFSISYVVVIVRGRMFNIGREYEEAAADLGASPGVALWKVLLPLLMPAIVASAAIVFAISIDDFVISQWLSNGPSTTTVPMEIYAATRAAPTPATNAIATVMVIVTLTSVVAGFLVWRAFTRGRARCQAIDDAGLRGIRRVIPVLVPLYPPNRLEETLCGRW